MGTLNLVNKFSVKALKTYLISEPSSISWMNKLALSQQSFHLGIQLVAELGFCYLD